jgi:diguanylate cyclase (GGDEF)-like protein/PAS domain S-box-containing protein
VGWAPSIIDPERGHFIAFVTVLCLVLALRVLGKAGEAARAAEEELRSRSEHFEALVRHATDVIGVLSPDGIIESVSPAIADLLGHSPGALEGTLMRDILHPDEIERARDLVARLPERAERSLTVEVRLLHADGSTRLTVATITAPDDWEGRMILNLHDITTPRGLEELLRHQATHDHLTGLWNRAAFHELVSTSCARSARHGSTMGVLFVDLDGFKQVNDPHGHAVGDQVLTMTAGRLLDAVRAGDLVARIGGDEFVVIAEQSDDAAATVRLGERLVEELAAPITIRSIATRIGASVGIAFAVDGEVDPDGLLRDADLATYRAKLRGRGRVEPFDEELRRELAARVEVERALRRAIDAGELELHFQPVVSPDGTASSVEALVRWHHPDGRMVPPDDFIPVAEGSDLIIDLDRWVLGEACRQLAAWADDPTLGALTVSVNLSGRHLLNLTVVDDVRRTLAETGADPASLVLEITETVILTDLPVVVEHLRRIRALGVRIAIDDFGTGYTSLTHLRSLPVDVVKIDRSMIVAELPSDTHVLKLLVDTVHALGLGLVAEGVETDAQLERLESLGCERVQGFLFSRAVPAGALRDAVRAARRATAP